MLRLWAGKGGGESAKFAMFVRADMKNRGVADVFFVVCDGLKGLPASVNAVFPRAINIAPSVDAAWAAFEELEEKWGKPYPAIPKLLRAAWEEFTPFLAYGGCRGIGACRPSPPWTDQELVVARSYLPMLRDQPMLLPVDTRHWLPP